MNKDMLLLIHDMLYAWLTKCREETISADKKLEILMLCIADLAGAIGWETRDKLEAYRDE